MAPGDQFICFVDHHTPNLGELGPNVRVASVALRKAQTVAASSTGYRSLADLLRLTRAVRRERLDVFFSPTVYSYFPLPPRLRSVVTIHDAIVERFPALTLPSLRSRLFWRLKVRLALTQSTLVLTVSEYSAEDLRKILGVSARRIRVATEAPAPVFKPGSSPDEIAAAAAEMGLPSGASWLIYVGGFNPHKRVDVLIRAHAAVAKDLGPRAPQLLLVGATTGDVFHAHLEELQSLIRQLGTEALVHWPGFVPDTQLRHLYAGSLAALLPSEAEGFGLPAVEAAACETAVVATRESPLPGLLGDGGIYVAPGDVHALSSAIHRVATDEEGRRRMARSAREHVQELSWGRTARRVLEVIEEAAGSGSVQSSPMAGASDALVGRNFAAFGLGDGLARFVGFGVTVYLARTLGADGYGVIALALGIVLYIQKLADYGVETLGIQRVAADPGNVGVIAGSYLAGRLAIASAVLVATAAVAYLLLPVPEGPILALFSLTVIPIAMNTNWVHLGLEDGRPVGFARLLGETMVAALVVVLVHRSDQLHLVPVSQAIGDAMAMAWLWHRLSTRGVQIRLHWDGTRMRALAASAWPLVAHAILGLVIYNSDLIFLRVYHDRVDVGLYAAAYTLISFTLNLGWVYGRSLLPTLTRLDREELGSHTLYGTAMAQVFVVAAPVTIGGWLVATPLLTSLFGQGFVEAGQALAILIWTVPFSLLRSVALAGLIAQERQDLVLRTTTGTAVANLLLNVLLIPSLGIIGAAWATVITDAVRTVLAMLFARRQGYPDLSVLRLLPSGVSALAMGTVVGVLPGLSVWSRVGLGAVVYLVVLTMLGAIRLRGGIRLTI
jgi:alpha-1,3-rhamnosyl/mannosyltransferase